MDKNEPTFVYRSNMTADKDYIEWLSDLKSRFQNNQLKAAVRVNSAMLEYYWNLGQDIVRKQAESKWGTGFFNQLSLDMRKMFPDETGFSVPNLKYMKRWYLYYFEQCQKCREITDGSDNQIRQRTIDENDTEENSIEDYKEIRQRPVDELEMPEIFGRIPWGHHIDIISRCKSMEEALFYIRSIVENGWSRPSLNTHLDNHFFQAQGSAVTNFEKALPSPQSRLATEILKDPYNFGFLTMKHDYDEKDLGEALVNNITQFLLELGKGFAFVGRQMELQMPNGQTFFPDLIFYHIPQHRYVVVELKTVKYIPEFAGKLNFYVTAADELLRGKSDNPSVGLIICKSSDNTVVEWSLKDINKPLGVATYQLQEVVDRTVLEIEQKRKEEKAFQW